MNTLRPTIRLRPREGRRVRSGAPWVFSNEIVMDTAAKALSPGVLVELASDDGRLIGTGYFNSKNLIAVRLLGPPKTGIGFAFFAEKLHRALGLREKFNGAPFYRLVHSEGDGLPGLVIDRFGKLCVIQITTAGMEQLCDHVLAALDAVIAPETIILKNDSPSRALEGLDNYRRGAKGQAPPRMAVEENGVQYLADPTGGQKSGWYYDQRENRAFMARLAKGARVLDVYCYSGGFGLLAARSGAVEVVGLDSSEAALALAQESAAMNGVAASCRFIECDVFEELERLGGEKSRFDLVICDPPPFARSRKDMDVGARAYRKLARLAASLVVPGGFLMLASCSHNVSRERFSLECAAGIARAARHAALIHEAGPGADHPVHPHLPETAYLKALLYAVD